jgi:hypothetical protein
MNLSEAIKIKGEYGFNRLFTEGDSNSKIAKSNGSKSGFHSVIMHLAPAKLSGYEVCPGRSAGCTKACLHTAGATHFQNNKDRYRIARTKFLFEQPEAFMLILNREIELHVKRSKKLGLNSAVRLNGTSDIIWEKKFPDLFDKYSKVQFYDYTKIIKRLNPLWDLPKNYYMTFSMSETSKNRVESERAIRWGYNVAVVFEGFGWSRFKKPFPNDGTYLGLPIFDGDRTDLRFLDPSNHIIGLRAKGKAYKENSSGFAVSISLPVLKVA